MSAVSVTVAGRRAAEAIMLDTCRIETGEVDQGPIDEGSGQYPAPEPVYSYEGKCRLKAADTAVSEIDAGAQLLVEQGFVLSLPIGASGEVLKNQVAEITAVHPITGDANLIGKRFRIEGPHHQTFATARRFRVQETT